MRHKIVKGIDTVCDVKSILYIYVFVYDTYLCHWYLFIFLEENCRDV